MNVLSDRDGAAPLPRPPRRGCARLPLSDRAAAHGVRQAVRVVGQGAAWTSSACAPRPRSFAGFKDFQSFTDDDPDEKSTRCCSNGWTSIEDGDLLLIRVEGSHFLWKMVRRLVGVLVAVGKGELKAAAIAQLLSGADVTHAWTRRPG